MPFTIKVNMSEPRHNKQHDMRAASLRRIAKGLRADARDMKARGSIPTANALSLVAARMDAEANLLRSMR
jgi:hypothetical protein